MMNCPEDIAVLVLVEVVAVVVVLVAVVVVSVVVDCRRFFRSWKYRSKGVYILLTQCLPQLDELLTAKRLVSYPPKTSTAASTNISGLILGIIVSFKVIGEPSNPAKTKSLLS